MNLKQWKLEHKHTYSRITNDLGGGYTPDWIARVINGKGTPSTALLMKLSNLTGLSYGEILRADEKK